MEETTSIKADRKPPVPRHIAKADYPALFGSADTAGPANDDAGASRIDTVAEQLAEAKTLLAAAYQKLILYRKELVATLAATDQLRVRLRQAEEREVEVQAELEEAHKQIAAYAETAAFAQQLLASSDEDLLRKRWWHKLLRL